MASTDADKSANSGMNVETSKQKPIGNFASIEDFTKESLVDIVKATKAVNAFPQGTARDLYCSYPTYGKVVDQQSHRILGLISKVLKLHNVKGNIQRRQPDEQFEMLLECNDGILERVNSNLDELAGIKKNPQTIIVESKYNTTPNGLDVSKGAGSWNVRRPETNVTNVDVMATARLITAKNIARPQTNFSVPVDNSSLSPFIPRLKEKPNSLKPLAILPEYDNDGAVVSYLHPYEFELMKFEVPAEQLKATEPIKPKDVNHTELVYIDAVSKLKTAIEELQKHKIIAIDVEHHSYRSFLGLTCLVQISTSEKDYIFDTLELREDMHLLNRIFTDPTIVKIFHGADSDIEWLQRDLSLYVVNMFDTHQAAKTLNFARLSLAYILKHYCDLELDKSFQLADWRMRPLPAELLEYARRDTHYLIYAFQRMTNDLLEAGNRSTNILSTVYKRCTEMCKKRYQKPTVTPTTHLELCRKARRVFDNRQLYALEHITHWRDEIARREDESYGYVLPNHMMLQISESLPREMQGILACCNPIPPLVRQHLHTLHQIILHAREQPLVKPILEPTELFSDSVTSGKVYNEKLHCSLDTTHDEEFRDDLPTLLRFENDKTIVNTLPNSSASLCSAKLTYFEKRVLREIVKPDLSKLILPYQRFLAYLPFAEQEKREEAARLEALTKQRRLCPVAPELVQLKLEKTIESTKPEDDLYSLPMREVLKRKHEEAVARKATSSGKDTPNAKRFKSDNSNRGSSKKSNPQSLNKVKDNSVVDLTNCDDNGSDDDDEPPIEVPIGTQDVKRNHNQAQKRKFKNRNRHNKRPKTQQASNQTLSNTAPAQTAASTAKNFDYKNVNFKKFSGGGKRAQGTELKPQFHGKNNSNKANNKKFNKLFTFSNVKGNKK